MADLAIIGLACRFPGAAGVDEFWHNCLEQRVQFRRMPAARMGTEYHSAAAGSPGAMDQSYAHRAALTTGYNFDWRAHRIPRSTFEVTDLAQWLALDMALVAIKDAGFEHSDLPRSRTRVVVGNTLTGDESRANSLRLRWPFVRGALLRALEQRSQKVENLDGLLADFEHQFKAPFPELNEDSLAGGLANTIAGRICNYLDLSGGGFIVDGACSSSLLAVAQAAEALESGACDLAITGGVDLSLDPFELVGFARAGALSRDQMHVYDRRARGFIPGEGCGMLVLQRTADARAQGRRIYAHLRGWGISSDGKGGITQPQAHGQALALERAYARAGYTPGSIDFIEGHGTGTPVGDQAEIEGMLAAGIGGERRCGLTSVKSLIGHTKAAAGVAGLIKASLAVHHRVLPATANCQRPHPLFEQHQNSIYPIIQGRRLDPEHRVRGSVSAMGFGGINCHITLESDATHRSQFNRTRLVQERLNSARSSEVFTFVGADHDELTAQLEALDHEASGCSDAELRDLSQQWQIPADDHPWRAALVVRDAEDLSTSLGELRSQLARGKSEPGGRIGDSGRWQQGPNRVPKLIFCYPGQGSQTAGMGARLLRRHAWARELWDEGVRALEPIDGELAHLLRTHRDGETWLDDAQLRRTEWAQPCLCLHAQLWSQWLMRLGIFPDAVGGHSLGEISCLATAGVLEFTELMQFAAHRGRLMAARDEQAGQMLALACSAEQALELAQGLSPQLTLACRNTPSQVVMAGAPSSVAELRTRARANAIAQRQLAVSNAFHTEYVQSASEQLAEHLEQLNFRQPTLELRLSGGIDGSTIDLRTYFANQVCAPVDFVGWVETLEGDECLIELGPGSTLSTFSSACGHNRELCVAVEAESESDCALHQLLAMLHVQGHSFDGDELRSGRRLRRFVSASDQQFITNPCERVPGKPPENARPRPTQAPPHVAPSPQPHTPVVAFQKQAETGDDPSEVFHRELCRSLGFDPGPVEPSQQLASDLHLNSIKSAELVASAAGALGLDPNFDASSLAAQPVGKIVEQLRSMLADHSPRRSGPPRNDHRQSAAEAQVLRRRPWVGHLVQELRPWSTQASADPASPPQILWHFGATNPSLIRLAESLGSQLAAVSDAQSDLPSDTSDIVILLPQRNSALASDASDWQRRIADMTALVALVARHSRVTLLDWPAQSNHDSSGSEAELCQGFAATLAQEYAHVQLRTLSFEPNCTTEQVAAGLRSPHPNHEGYYREHCRADSSRWRPQLVHHRSQAENTEPTITESDRVLVTGGASGITAACVLSLARQCPAHFVLVGRSPAEGPDARPGLAQHLQALRDLGAEASYHSCDLGRPEQVRELLNILNKRNERPTVVIHGAGVNHARRADEATPAQIEEEWRAKLLGASLLINGLKKQPPRIQIALTSVIGVCGLPGNAWYALANAELARLIRPEHSGAAWSRALAYSVWQDIGMGARMGVVAKLARDGVTALSVEQATESFVQLATHHDSAPEVVISGRGEGLAYWPIAASQAPGCPLSFLEHEVRHQPEMELWAKCQLHLDTDPYLEDHQFDGSLVFPAVFGLEAMAQAARRLVEAGEYAYTAKSLRFARAIRVPKDKGTSLYVHALRDPHATGDVFDVELGELTSDGPQPAFSARLQLTRRKSPAAQAQLPDDSRQPLAEYGGVLFQSGEYQRLVAIEAFERETDRGHCRLALRRQAPTPAKLGRRQALQLGNPFVRDAFLQSVQLLIPEHRCLPVGIEHWQLASESGNWRAHLDCQLHGLKDRRYRSSVQCGEEQLTGYLAQIVDVRPANQRPRLPIEALTMLQKELTSDDIELRWGEYSAIDARPQTERRQRAQDLLGREGPRITWNADGRPLLENSNISITHAGDLLMLIHGDRALGCDLEHVQPRPPTTWATMLGSWAPLRSEITNTEDNLAHTLLWSAREAARKAGCDEPPHEIRYRAGEVQFDLPGMQVRALGLGTPAGGWVFSVAKARPHSLSYDVRNTRMGTRTRGQGIEFWRRHPISFQSCAHTDGSVYFSHFFTWMGQAREDAIAPIGSQLIELLETGHNALFTTLVDIEILAPVQVGQVLEVTVTCARSPGRSDFELQFGWYRVDAGQRRVIARGVMGLAWAEMDVERGGHRLAPLPQQVRRFLDQVCTSEAETTTDHLQRGPELKLPPQRLWTAHDAQQTGLQHANPVGNIYFSHFAHWLGQARDRLVHRKASSKVPPFATFSPSRTRLEFKCDARPFDTITSELELAAVAKEELHCRVVFQRDGQLLAIAEQITADQGELCHDLLQTGRTRTSHSEGRSLNGHGNEIAILHRNLDI